MRSTGSMTAWTEVLAHSSRGACRGAANAPLREALLRGAQQEPADEGGPKPADPVAVERLPDANENHHVGENLARVRGDLRRALEIPGHAPGQGAQDASAIERESRDQIEYRQSRIDLPQPAGGGDHHLVP